MRRIEHHYIDGAFVPSHGQDEADLINPATEEVIGAVRLGDADDAERAVAAAYRAQATFGQSGKEERLALLARLHAAVALREADMLAAMIEEYGAPASRAPWMVRHAIDAFQHAAAALADYPLTRSIGQARVDMTPVGVSALITPWNSNAGFICNKLASAIAAGCTTVIKPSEMSALQTRVVVEALHAAQVPAGLFNVVNGRGDVVGTEFVRHPHVAKVSFTGSTAVGKGILRTAAESIKRVTLELGGKSPVLILDDAELAPAITLAVEAGFQNSGQACIAGSRILLPRSRLDAAIPLLRDAVARHVVGDPHDPATRIGPMVSQRQWARVQDYIRLGMEEGARIVSGGLGRPAQLTRGYFVQPTVFVDVRNDMRIAREEIFGPVLSVIAYDDDEQAIALANDTDYGLQAYVITPDAARARRLAARLQAGRVLINGLSHEPMAPFGGVKQSGIGREFGVFGLEAYLEPKTVLGA
ncbi:MAG: aldehyde dehydrogenase family protein [Rhodocyclaceae bacterium]